MRVKRVNRYYCDFCKKSGCSKWHIEQHEKHCTMNPNRECRVCMILGVAQTPMSELLAILPKVTWDYPEPLETCYMCAPSLSSISLAQANDALPALRDRANNCPACIMAAIRQKGFPVAAIDDFDFSSEMRAIGKAQHAEVEEE